MLDVNWETSVLFRSRSHVQCLTNNHTAFCRPGLLQVDGLGETEVEMATCAEDDVFVSVLLTIFLTGARRRAGRGVSFFAGAAFGEDAGGLDHDLPAAQVQTHQHDPQIAWFERMPERAFARISERTRRGLGFEHAAGRGGAAGDERLAVDHDRLIDGGAESVSRM